MSSFERILQLFWENKDWKEFKKELLNKNIVFQEDDNYIENIFKKILPQK